MIATGIAGAAACAPIACPWIDAPRWLAHANGAAALDAVWLADDGAAAGLFAALGRAAMALRRADEEGASRLVSPRDACGTWLEFRERNRSPAAGTAPR